MNNRILYKRIMEDVSRVVKKHLNESADTLSLSQIKSIIFNNIQFYVFLLSSNELTYVPYGVLDYDTVLNILYSDMNIKGDLCDKMLDKIAEIADNQGYYMTEGERVYTFSELLNHLNSNIKIINPEDIPNNQLKVIERKIQSNNNSNISKNLPSRLTNKKLDPVKIEKILANAVKSDKIQIIGTIYDNYACDIDDAVEYLESLGYDADDNDLYSLLDKLPISCYNFQYVDPGVVEDAVKRGEGSCYVKPLYIGQIFNN